MTNIHDQETLEETVGKFASITEELWYEHTRQVHMTKYSKAWWNKEYSRKLSLYQTFRKRLDWLKYKNNIKLTKYTFFDNKFKKLQ